MSVKRRDLVRYLQEHGFYLLREGGRHSIYTDGARVVPVKRHRTLDRVRPHPQASLLALTASVCPVARQ